MMFPILHICDVIRDNDMLKLCWKLGELEWHLFALLRLRAHLAIIICFYQQDNLDRYIYNTIDENFILRPPILVDKFIWVNVLATMMGRRTDERDDNNPLAQEAEGYYWFAVE